jgi:phosphatidylglycerophosphatase C
MALSGRTVVFDLDGVLLRGDSTIDYLRRRARRAPWLLPAMAVAACGFALSDRHALARSTWSHRVVASALLGRRLTSVTQELKELAHAIHRSTERVPQRVVETLRGHLADGDRVLISSAGLEPFVRAWVELLGASEATVAASRLEQRPWGVVMADHHYGRRKLERALELGFGPDLDLVYSDSDADLPLLQAARDCVLVAPSNRTLDGLPADVRSRATIWS